MSENIEILRMPKLGMSMTEGKVTEWYYQIGDTIEAGDEVLEVSTEKINHGICCHNSGILHRILVAVDQTVKVETALAVIAPNNLSGADIDQLLTGNG